MKLYFSILLVLTASSAFCQTKFKTADVYTKEFAYAFTDYVTINLTFGSDSTLYWIEPKSGKSENEKITTIHLNDYMTLTGWVETNKTIVSLFSNFATGETYGFQYFSSGKVRKLIGTIKPKQ